ncbi:MAG: hypothetical protein AAGA66_12755 [Bacteroidota bacterium]
MKYPVFALQENNDMVYVFLNERDLKSTNTDLLQKGIFNNVKLTDSEGSTREIKKVFKVKYLGFQGISLLKKGRQILVDFEYESESILTDLEEFKKEVIRKVKSKKQYWLTSWGNVSELVKRIENCESFNELADLMK